MMNPANFDAILDDCLARLLNGESIEACLRRYPDYADQLAPLLSIAQQIQRTPPPQMRPEAFAAGRKRLRAAVAAHKTPPRPSRPWLQLAWPILALLLAGLFVMVRNLPETGATPAPLQTAAIESTATHTAPPSHTPTSTPTAI